MVDLSAGIAGGVLGRRDLWAMTAKRVVMVRSLLSPAKKRLLGEGAWVAFGMVMGTVALLVGMRVLTEIVQPDVYGTVTLILGVMNIGIGMFVVSILQAAIRFYADAAREDTVATLRRTIRAMLVPSVALLALLALGGGIAASMVWDIPYAAFLALAGLVVATAGKSFETSLLTAARRQQAFAIWNSLESWARPALAVLLVLWLGSSPQAVILGYFLAVGGVYLGFRCLPFKRVGALRTVEADGGLRADIWRFALPMIPLAVVGWTVNLGDRYIIGGLLGAEAVGLYAASYGLVSMPFIMAQGVIATTLRPVYYAAVAERDRRLERRVFRLWLLGTAAICSLGVAAVWALHPWIAAVFLAAEYRAGAELMPWIALGNAFFATSMVFGIVCFAYKRTGLSLVVGTFGAVASVAVTIPMVLYFGLTGAAAAVPIFFGLQLVASALAALAAKRGSS